MTTTLARARALIEAAKKATDAPWQSRPLIKPGSLSGAIVSPAGDAELGNWMICEQVRWPTDRTFIAAARNDAPDIARALVEAVEIARTVAALDGRYLSVEAHLAIERTRAWLAKHGDKT